GNGSQSTSPSGAGGKNGVQTLLFESISTEGQLALNDKNVGLRFANEGLITMSWNTKTGIDIDSKSILFSMNFVAKKDGKLSEVLRIGSQRTKAESYEGIGELGNLSLRFTKNGKEVTGTNTLYQNYPNPFDQRTVIGINLAQSTQGMMKITDVTGRVVKTIDREWNKGYNEVWLDKREVKATGILFYTFESKGFTASRRMVIVE
ncbi:MAG: T9SS type A sorting domain-containing protein, partial [Saprospiraceae bacterium]|nr:T9SS type A sorting domain-containing protein [Saprospiraceae bacterium]